MIKKRNRKKVLKGDSNVEINVYEYFKVTITNPERLKGKDEHSESTDRKFQKPN